MMEDWVKNVWERRPGALCNLDVIRGHLRKDLNVKLERKDCDLVLILGGINCRIQPLDVSVNRLNII
jgi:hypothetical protein